MTLTGAPIHNPVTGARRYTGAEFVVGLWQINGTSRVDLAPVKPKPDRKRTA